jgi:hypothetical protein
MLGRGTAEGLALAAFVLVAVFHGYFAFFWSTVDLLTCTAFVVAAGLLAQEVAPWLEEG